REQAELFPSEHIPHTEGPTRLVAGPGDQRPAVGGKRERTRILRERPWRPDAEPLPARGHVPEDHVPGGRGARFDRRAQEGAVGGEGHTGNPAARPAETAEFLPRGRVPKAGGAVLAAAGQRLAVRGQCQGPGASRVHPPAYDPPAGQLPGVDTPVPAGADEG